MKKILIFTFQRANNYGALLQAYALQRFLEKKDYKCQICDYRNETIENPYKLICFENLSLINIIKQIIKLFIFGLSTNKRIKSFDKFRNDYLKLSLPVKSVEDLRKIDYKPDVYITGSDQVWNPNIVGELSDIYALNIADDVKKVSYAASVGDTSYINEYKEQFLTKLRNIDNLSVREKDTKEVLSNMLNRKIDTTIDPTLLLSNEDWNLILPQFEKNENYIFTYYVASSNKYFEVVNYVSALKKQKIVHCSKKKCEYKKGSKSIYDLGPIEFINYIKNSDMVITSSFHATVFSLIFHKEFVVVLNESAGERIRTLLSIVGLEDRMLRDISDLDNLKQIDWNFVDTKLSEEKNKSIDWLIASLK